MNFCFTYIIACDNVLSFVCQWYIKMFAHIQTNDYIFETIHSNLEKLPWQRFIPTPVDLDLIMKVMNDNILFSLCGYMIYNLDNFLHRLWINFYHNHNAF